MGIFRKRLVNYKVKKGTLYIIATKKQLRKSCTQNPFSSFVVDKIYFEAHEDMNLKLDPNKINIFATLEGNYINCEAIHKNYIGPLYNLPFDSLSKSIQYKLMRAILNIYVMLTTVYLKDGKRLHIISEDLRECTSDFTSLVCTNLLLDGDCDLAKYEYRFKDNKLLLEKKEDYHLYGNRNIKVKIGDVYIIKYHDECYVYGGTNSGTFMTKLDSIYKGVIYETFKEEGLYCHC